jgi:hypothetical protein
VTAKQLIAHLSGTQDLYTRKKKPYDIKVHCTCGDNNIACMHPCMFGSFEE